MDVQNIALEALKPWPQNPRQGTADVADLVASIKAEGLLQPLIVAPNGDGYYVIAGNRRLRALQAIAAEGGYTTAPCHVLPDGYDDDKLLEVALAENVIRLDMHPIDECEAFAQLAAKGKDVAGVAAAFNVSERYVKQRLALGSLPEAVRADYRAGKIGHRDAVDLARLNDPKLAAKAYKAAVKSGTSIDYNARKAANEKGRFYVENARFDVPASMKTVEDFFDDAGPYFVDYDKALHLQGEVLAKLIIDMREQGEYAFVEIQGPDDYSKYRRVSDTEKKGVGLVYKVDRDGAIEAVRCISIAAERKAEKEKAKVKAKKQAKQAAKAAGEPEPEPEVESVELPHALQRDIEALRVAAVMIAAAGGGADAVYLKHQTLAAPPTLAGACHQDVRAECEAVVGELLREATARSLLALYLDPYKVAGALKHLNEVAAYDEIDWPRSLVARLPRPALELEARALGITDLGADTKKAELVEKVWKAKTERWVPVFACNG